MYVRKNFHHIVTAAAIAVLAACSGGGYSGGSSSGAGDAGVSENTLDNPFTILRSGAYYSATSFTGLSLASSSAATVSVADAAGDNYDVGLKATGEGTLTFNFADNNDTIVLGSGSTISGFHTLKVSGGTVDVSAATLDGIVRVDIDSKIILTESQFEKVPTYFSTSGNGEIDVKAVNASEANNIVSDLTGNKVEIYGAALTIVDGSGGQGNDFSSQISSAQAQLNTKDDLPAWWNGDLDVIHLIMGTQEIAERKAATGASREMKLYISPGGDQIVHNMVNDVEPVNSLPPTSWQEDYIDRNLARAAQDYNVSFQEVAKADAHIMIVIHPTPNRSSLSGNSDDFIGKTLMVSHAVGLPPEDQNLPIAQMVFSDEAKAVQEGIFVHELGHMLGLEHPSDYRPLLGDYDRGVAENEAQVTRTIMGDWPEAETLTWFEPIDEAALKTIWGGATQ